MAKWINVSELKYNILKIMGSRDTLTAKDIAELINQMEQVEFEPQDAERKDE